MRNVALLLILVATIAPAQTKDRSRDFTPPHYSVTPLSAYGSGQTNIGRAISNSTVAGSSTHSDNSTHAALFGLDGKTFQDLGILPNGTTSVAQTVNDFNQAAGWADNGSDAPFRAVLFTNGVVIEIPDLPLFLNGTQAFANGINNGAQIVGSQDGDPALHGFMYRNGELSDLGENYDPLAINESGQNVGQVTGNFAYGAGHAAFFHDDVLDDLGVLRGDNFSVALAINNSNVIVGSSYKCIYTEPIPGCLAKHFPHPSRHFFKGHGFVYDDGKMKALRTPDGYLQTQAMGINSAGTIVGCGLVSVAAGYSALIWVGHEVYDLNTLVPSGTPHITCGFGINDAGQIVTYDSLLTPVKE
jgi:probable HAF family extracellular repeat protein